MIILWASTLVSKSNAFIESQSGGVRFADLEKYLGDPSSPQPGEQFTYQPPPNSLAPLPGVHGQVFNLPIRPLRTADYKAVNRPGRWGRLCDQSDAREQVSSE